MLVLKSIAEERYAICKSCPRFTVLKICSICNCIMPIKVKFAKASCPEGRWQSVNDLNKHQFEPYDDLT